MAGPGHAACWGYLCWGYFKDEAFSTLQGAASNTFPFFFGPYIIFLCELLAVSQMGLWPQQPGDGKMNSPYTVSSYTQYTRGKVGTKQGLTSLGLYRHLLGLVILFVQSIPCSMTTWNALNKQYFFLLLQNTIIGLNFCSVLTQCI